jgi:hypothetical protein
MLFLYVFWIVMVEGFMVQGLSFFSGLLSRLL